MNADTKMYAAVNSFLERQKLDREGEVEEQYCTKINIRSGPNRASISIFNTGRMTIGGRPSPSKKQDSH
jgi:hypothetical protein